MVYFRGKRSIIRYLRNDVQDARSFNYYDARIAQIEENVTKDPNWAECRRQWVKFIPSGDFDDSKQRLENRVSKGHVNTGDSPELFNGSIIASVQSTKEINMLSCGFK